MNQNEPLVSIGIPTYNRAVLLRRSIDTALKQDYGNIEVIVSDNASTDDTRDICKRYCARDGRLRYILQSENLGPTANFAAVMNAASGEYFMWLGDDDWLDTDYVSTCLRTLIRDSRISLVSGTPRYYQNGQFVNTGKIFNLVQESAWSRVTGYFAKVADNGMFYGLMRTSRIQQLEITNLLGGDWLLIAALAFTGKIMALPDTSVHRDLGGATTSHRRIAETLGISRFNSLFPMTSIATNVWRDIVSGNAVYRTRSGTERVAAATIIVFILMLTAFRRYTRSAIRRIRNGVKSRLVCTS